MKTFAERLKFAMAEANLNQSSLSENKQTILEKTRQRRQKPEVKARRAEYDKAYRQTPAGKEAARRKRQKYYDKNKDKINERRREKWKLKQQCGSFTL